LLSAIQSFDAASEVPDAAIASINSSVRIMRGIPAYPE
jgi:hypothetical protein